jgi:hypothetical protein
MKKHLISWSIIMSFLVFTTLPHANGYTFILLDNAYDVAHLINYTYQKKGAYSPEVDITRVVINGSNVEITLVGEPKVDKEHLYHYRIHWDGNQSHYSNYSQASLGSSYNLRDLANYSLTHIVDSTGQVIIDTILEDTIRLAPNKVIMPIVNHTFIQNLSDVAWIKVYATYTYYEWGQPIYWGDFVPDSEAWWLWESPTYPTYSNTIPSVGFIGFLIAILPIIIIKIKKRRFYRKSI